MVDVELVLVGDELLKGERSDAHLAYVGRSLLQCGVSVARAQTVGDREERIAAAVGEAIARARVVIVTGGLGPTDDDVTRDGVADAMGLELEFDETSWQRIRAFFASRGVEPTDANLRQAQFPAGAVVIPNDRGTAPGFRVDGAGAVVFVLPGPPRELQPMLDTVVIPELLAIFNRPPLRVETFRTIGVGESQLFAQYGDVLTTLASFRMSSLPSITGVDIVLTQKSATVKADRMNEEADDVDRALRTGLGSRYYERGTRSLSHVVGDLLSAAGETLGVAESLTGGLISKLFTDTSGSSAYLLAGACVYSNDSKVAMLHVRDATLAEFGAVSAETCTEMAHGIRNRTGATWGIATTGIAGPGGATPRKPVGLVFIGVAWEGGSQIKRVQYGGERDDVRHRAANGAIWLLFDQLTKRR